MVTETIPVKRFCSRPLSGSRTATIGIGRVAGSVCRPIPWWVGRCIGFAVVMAQVRRPVPFRTRKLRPGRGDGTALERVWESSAPPHSTVWTFWSSPLRDSRKVPFFILLGVPAGRNAPGTPFFCFSSGFFRAFTDLPATPFRLVEGVFRGLRPSRSSGPPGRASMTPRRVLLLSGAYRRTRVAGDPFFSHDRSDWMVGCGSKLDASLFSNVVQDLQHSIAILLFADVACGMQYPDHFIPFRPHASQFFSAAYPRATNTGLPPSSSSSSLNPLRFSSTRFGSFLSVFSTSPELVSW